MAGRGRAWQNSKLAVRFGAKQIPAVEALQESYGNIPGQWISVKDGRFDPQSSLARLGWGFTTKTPISGRSSPSGWRPAETG